ncbi:MAG: CPBP family intramembrane metalloprotease [Planctomycetota bacterium]|nr:CPBP family intramembrane metalloprotease [Planctomycetota bacterium]
MLINASNARGIPRRDWMWPLTVVGMVLWMGMQWGWFSFEGEKRGQEEEPAESAQIAPVTMAEELQGKLVFGLWQFVPATEDGEGATTQIRDEMKPMREGSIAQRLAAAAFLDATGNKDQAKFDLAAVEALVSDPPSDDGKLLVAAVRKGVAGTSLDDEERARLAPLGWYAKLVEARSENNAAALNAMRSSGLVAIGVLIAFGFFLLVAGIFGTILLIILLVRFFSTNPVANVPECSQAQIAAGEIFGAYLLLAGLLNVIASVTFRAGQEDGESSMSVVWGMALQMGLMCIPLVTLFLARRRGVSFTQLRTAMGIHRGKGILSEVIVGLGVYCMLLPLALCGLGFYFLLDLAFGGGSPPSHPIVSLIRDGSTLDFVMIFILASVFAPILEELFFRGGFFEGLRARWGKKGMVVAFSLAALVSSFVFAAIHPQGILFVPVLGGLAIGLCIGRVWRKSLIAPIVAHSLNNGLITLINLAMWS